MHSLEHARLSRRTMLATAAAFATPSSLTSQTNPAETTKKIRVGVVGGRFGLQFQWHLHPNSEVTAVCDVKPEPLAALAKTYRTDNTYRSFNQFLKHRQLDAVAIFTPAPLHAWMSIQAMEAGKHVVCAVPAGLTVEELDRLIECVKRTGMRYMMAETTYYRPQIITCRKLANEGRFGQIFYSESEYHHNIIRLMFDERGMPTWRHGFPPMWYITHQTGAVIPVGGQRLREVSAIGWGDGHEVLRANLYQNPFWNTTGFFKTTGGCASRISVFWNAPAGMAQRSQFYGSKLSYVMGRGPEKHPDTTMRFDETGGADRDSAGYVEHAILAEPQKEQQEKHWPLLPSQLHVRTGHEGSHTHITHQFVQSVLEERHPEVNVWEAAAYTVPGLIAHQSALRGGESMKIPDFGLAPTG